MVKVTFEYRDAYTAGHWATRTCVCESVEECIEWYGLGKDCEYHILSVEEMPE